MAQSPTRTVDGLVATALARAPLSPSAEAGHHSRMVVDLDRPLHLATPLDEAQALGRLIAAPLVDRAARAASLWAHERSGLGPAVVREVTVRANRCGELQLKFILANPCGATPPAAALSSLARGSTPR